MAELKYGDKIIVLGVRNIRRGTIEDSTTTSSTLTGLYYVNISGNRSLVKLEDIFPDTREGKKGLINVIENRIIALDDAKDQLFKELRK